VCLRHSRLLSVLFPSARNNKPGGGRRARAPAVIFCTDLTSEPVCYRDAYVTPPPLVCLHIWDITLLIVSRMSTG